MQTKHIASNNYKERWANHKQERIKALIEFFYANGRMPPTGTTLHTFYKRNKRNPDLLRRLRAAQVDLLRNGRIIPRETAQGRFIENYKQRGRMPAKSMPGEQTDDAYWTLRKNDPDFLWLLISNGVDICRSLKVVRQEKIYEQWREFVRIHKDLPKDKRKQVFSQKTGDLPEDMKQEDYLRRWQYNVLRGNIACLSFCQINIKQKILETIETLKAEKSA